MFVEDDDVIARIYSETLAEEGFDVAVAEDGLAAITQLPEFKPDLVVLDILMPKLNGVDVLKFMRQHPALKTTRVVVFSNLFLNTMVEQAANLGIEEALVKAAVTPARLSEVVHKILDRAAPDAWTPGVTEPPQVGATPRAAWEPVPAHRNEGVAESHTHVPEEFFGRIPVVFKDARQLCREFLEATESATQLQRLEGLNRKFGILTQMTGIAGFHHIAELTSAIEALLFELRNRPALINDSCRHTIASAMSFLSDRLDQAESVSDPNPPPPTILVVDDDAVSNRALVLALGRAKLSATSVADPYEALDQLHYTACQLIFLDINLPGMDGLALCEQIRRLPIHKRTPVIFVTGRTDFETRDRLILSGGNDLITKPILPAEVCVKALTYLLKAG
jgi:CheY-like chemotaxis protein